MMFDDDDQKAEHVAMDNIWALVQNNEYVLSRVFQPYDIFPGEHSYDYYVQRLAVGLSLTVCH